MNLVHQPGATSNLALRYLAIPDTGVSVSQLQRRKFPDSDSKPSKSLRSGIRYILVTPLHYTKPLPVPAHVLLGCADHHHYHHLTLTAGLSANLVHVGNERDMRAP